MVTGRRRRSNDEDSSAIRNNTISVGSISSHKIRHDRYEEERYAFELVE